MPSGMVYLIRAGDLYKIGRTRNLLYRIQSIGLELGMSVRLLHCWYTREPSALERLFHTMMRSERICGEWFRLKSSDLDCLTNFRFSRLALLPSPYHPPNAHYEVIPIVQTVRQSAIKCLVCGHMWIVQEGRHPKRCPHPKCRSLRWNKPGVPERPGRPRKPKDR